MADPGLAYLAMGAIMIMFGLFFAPRSKPKRGRNDQS